MSTRRVYELLDGLQEGVHAYLETYPDTKPQAIFVRIDITDDEVIVKRLDGISKLRETMTKLMDSYKARLAEIRTKIEQLRIVKITHPLEQEKMKLEAKLSLLSLLMVELDG